MRRTLLAILPVLMLLAACAPAPTAAPTATAPATSTPQTVLVTATPWLVTATPAPTATASPTPAASETPTPEPTEVLVKPTATNEAPDYHISSYFVKSFSDMNPYFQSHPNDNATSYFKIVTDPNGQEVFEGVINGPGGASDGRDRAYLGVGAGGPPGFQDFNPGSWGTEFILSILPGHPKFQDTSSNAYYVSVFSAFDVGDNPIAGTTDKYHPSFELLIEHANLKDKTTGDWKDTNALAIYGYTKNGAHEPIFLGKSFIPIDDGKDVNVKVIEVPSPNNDGTAQVKVWVNDQFDPNLSKRITEIYRIGVARGTHWGPYAYKYEGPLTMTFKNIKLFKLNLP